MNCSLVKIKKKRRSVSKCAKHIFLSGKLTTYYAQQQTKLNLAVIALMQTK